MEKIHYLCSKISEVEWSGILLYSVKGSIKEPKNMELHVEDIIPMDKRSAGYTEYEYNKRSLFDINKFDDKHIDYIEEMCEEHPEVLKWKIGHIHSHNSMSVFFSSTDMEEIKDNSKSHNFYLSLIVNNNMDTIAKVASYAEAKDSVDASFLARDENGKEYEIKKQKLNFKESIYNFYDCQIIKEDIKPRVDTRFIKTVDTIIKEAEKRTTTSYGNFGQNYFTPLENSCNRDKNYFQKHYNPWEKEILSDKNKFQYVNLETSSKNSFNKFQEKSYKAIQDTAFNDLEISVSPIEAFTVYILNNGEEEENTTVEEFLSIVEEEIMERGDWFYDVKDFIVKYPDYYAEFFPELAEDEQYFIEVTNSVIEILSEAQVRFDFVLPLIKGLNRFLKTFNEIR